MQVKEKKWSELLLPDPQVPGSTLPLLHSSDDTEFLNGVLERLGDEEKWPGVEGIIVFENLQMDSSQVGTQAVLPYGPGCQTIKELQPVLDSPMTHRLGETPSVFKYPVYYVTREQYLAERDA